MRPQLFLLRRPAKQPQQALRTFFQSSAVRYGPRTRPRPQLPFLSVTSAARNTPRVRFLTTERKERLKYEVKLGIKYTAYIWIAVGAVFIMCVAVSQEMLEREYPTPHEWSHITRHRFRGGHCERDQTDPRRITNWNRVLIWIRGALERLEDPAIDGEGVKDAPSDRPPGTKDISAKPESWRRGYYEAMMLYAKAAEHMDGWVRDKERKILFPPGVMIGPSNPRPKPLPPGMTGPRPKEEDCELAYEPADDIYQRLILTEGLTPQQRMTAMLAYANWLEFNGEIGPAGILYKDATIAAMYQRMFPAEPVDRNSWTLNEAAGAPSENVLKFLNEYASFKARTGDTSFALPIYVSLLKARKRLPLPDPSSLASSANHSDSHNQKVLNQVLSLFKPPPYPPPPPDGTAPPVRDSKELCEEAALSLSIGEILFANAEQTREGGVAWTREAVDMAEEQLHKLGRTRKDRRAYITCCDSMAVGLSNWSDMVATLTREEAAKKEAREAQPPPKTAPWYSGLWSEKEVEDLTRWKAEERVIEERVRRSRDLLEELKPPSNGLASLFTA